ncbi:MAG: hypothetical protein ACFFHV_00955 [Promethearchaeota archaeon]
MVKREEANVLTVRINKEIDELLEKVKERKGTTKAMLIRNYLEMIKYISINNGSIRSLDDRNLVIIKRKTFKNYLKNFGEEEQIRQGIKLAESINDIARVQGKLDDISYKLDLCEHLGFFPKFIDEEGYILFSDKFGPKKFVEAFIYKLINFQPDDEYDMNFSEEGLEKSKDVRKDYQKKINPVKRASSYYAFEFAKIPVVEEEG